MVVQALGQACAFITAILLARHLNMKDYGFYIFDVTVATIIAVVATMGAGGILARTWGKSDLKSNFERHKETFRVHNWYFKRGFAIVVIVIALIIFYNRSEHSDNSIENFALLFAVPFLWQIYFNHSLLQEE